MNTPSWLHKAHCRGMDPNYFFPDVGVSIHHTEAIRKLCKKCPVNAECLELGLESQNDEFGFFGGKSPRERQAINTQRKRDARVALRQASRVSHYEPTQTLGMGEQTETSMEGCGIVGGPRMASCAVCTNGLTSCARPVWLPREHQSTT